MGEKGYGCVWGDEEAEKKYLNDKLHFFLGKKLSDSDLNFFLKKNNESFFTFTKLIV